jgi:hypothetical protein
MERRARSFFEEKQDHPLGKNNNAIEKFVDPSGYVRYTIWCVSTPP